MIARAQWTTAVAFVVASNARADQGSELRALERTPLVVVPHDVQRGALATSRIADLLAPHVLHRTGFEVFPAERAGLDPETFTRCTKNRLGCWLRSIASSMLGVQRFHALFVGVDTIGSEIELNAIYVDVNPEETPISDEERERRALETAVVLRSERVALADEDRALASWAEQAIEIELRPVFEKTGNWLPFGELEIVTTVEGLTLEIDGRNVGVLSRGRTRVIDVMHGMRNIVLRDPLDARQVAQARLSIEPGTMVTFRASPLIDTPVRIEGPLFLSGVGASAAGLALMALAFAHEAGPDVFVCGGLHCRTEQGPRFSAFCDLGSRGGHCGGLGSTRIAPLGISLLGAGAVWAIGELLADEDHRWWIVLTGIGAGVLAYSLSAIAE